MPPSPGGQRIRPRSVHTLRMYSKPLVATTGGFLRLCPSLHPALQEPAVTQTLNLRVTQIDPLISPDELHARLPAPESSTRFIAGARTQVERVLHGEDSRLLAIVGPCSIHDPVAALEYASKLKVA